MEKNESRKLRFALIWSKSRADAGKTREFMAEGLGVSQKTIQNWEKGITSPDFFEGSEWFHILGLNPIPYYLSYLFPELFEREIGADVIVGARGGREETGEAELGGGDVDSALNLLIQNLTLTEKQQLLYIMAGNHGSPWYSLLQLFTAHCHTSLRSRASAASEILDNYRLEEALGELVCPEGVAPDVDMIDRAIATARDSVVKGLSGYTNVGVEK